MLLSIIIINYNTFQLTCDCIQSIKQTTHVEHEIILVDNNSKERAATDFLQVFPDVQLLALTENVGFGRANNAGVEKAAGKYVLLLNSDTLVKEATVDETVAYLESNPSVDILGCKVFTDGGAVQKTVYEYKGELSFFRSIVFFIKRNAIMKELIGIVYKQLQKRKQKRAASAVATTVNGEVTTHKTAITPNYQDGKRIGALVGVFLLLKRSVYIESKGFDPDFFMYHEELDWFLKRLRKYNVVYYPDVSITHFFGKSDVYRKMSLQLHVSHYLFWYKMSVGHFILYFLYNIAEIPSRAIMSLVTFNKKYISDVPVFFKAFPYALFDIPRYSNRYGGRKEMLKLRSLRKKGL